ncbi:YdcF family protein [Ammonifex thiophilus]|uniref:YdcF family protein n=1 Tax=Ammonifex thiophilus TaxID=444093 RepID=A0A3D8P4R1_9THEO|nr:YdcF family protein [Ammonifex thiophilus]
MVELLGKDATKFRVAVVRVAAVLALLLLLLLSLLAGLYCYTERFGRLAQPQPADAIIVLGAAVWPQGPSPAFQERLLLAAELYRQGYAPVIIVTGGVGEYNPTPEGEAGKNFLLARGIPASALYAETASRNTRENLLGARSIMRAHGWRRAIIVTHDFHLWRALREAEAMGIEASGAGVKETVLVRPPLVLREALANLVSLLSGLHRADSLPSPAERLGQKDQLALLGAASLS